MGGTHPTTIADTYLDNTIVRVLAYDVPGSTDPAGSQQEVDVMTMTRRPSPFGELMTLRQAMDRLFDDMTFRPFSGFAGTEHARLPLHVLSAPDQAHRA
jgi:hypothetical protein